MNEDFSIRTWNLNTHPNQKDWYEYLIYNSLFFIFPLEMYDDKNVIIRNRPDDYTNRDTLPKSYDDAGLFKRGVFQFLDIFPVSKERAAFHSFKRNVVNKLNYSVSEYIEKTNTTILPNGSYSYIPIKWHNIYIPSYKTNPAYKGVVNTYMSGRSSQFLFENKFSYITFDYGEKDSIIYYNDDEIIKIRSGWQRSDGFRGSLVVEVYNHYKKFYPEKLVENNGNIDIRDETSKVLSKYTAKELDTILCKFLVELLNN